MASLLNTRRGRPSKGPRHSFTIKLDLERAAKLQEILRTLNTNGIEYLTPIVEAHIDAIDLDHCQRIQHKDVSATRRGPVSLCAPVPEAPTQSRAERKRQLFDRLRREILAARLKVTLDEQLNRETSDTVKALAGMKLPQHRWGE